MANYGLEISSTLLQLEVCQALRSSLLKYCCTQAGSLVSNQIYTFFCKRWMKYGYKQSGRPQGQLKAYFWTSVFMFQVQFANMMHAWKTYTKYKISRTGGFRQVCWKLHFWNQFLTPRPTYTTGGNHFNNFARGSRKEHSCIVLSNGAMQLRRCPLNIVL